MRPGDRQRHHRRPVLHQRRVRAQRGHPRDGRQPARVHPPAGQHDARHGGQDDRRHRGQRGALRLPRRRLAVHRDPAEQGDRLRGRRQDRQALRREQDDRARGRRGPRLRRARRGHRGAAGQGPGHHVHDPPGVIRRIR
ncbi:hypothetical protein MICRO11B_660017 [Micrococcus luteus]|nr:hypothetical protein MICRO11B_660017 [Micrococcus luteus]